MQSERVEFKTGTPPHHTQWHLPRNGKATEELRDSGFQGLERKWG